MSKQQTINQHYVPQFYFDQFFTAPFCYLTVTRREEERILFSKKANKKTQSSATYFYGADQELEESYEALENDASVLIKKIIDGKAGLTISEFEILAKFILSQAVRTKGFLHAFINMLEQYAKVLNCELEYSKEIILYNFFGITSEITYLISDLKIKVVDNNTNSELIFSDNPIQIYNSFTPHSHGLIMAGVTIIFPLNTKKLLVIYDDKMLNIESFSMTENDVKEYNKLLAVNSDEKIYFQNESSKAEYEGIINEIKKYRKPSKLDVLGSSNKKMVSFKFPQFNTRPNFSFLKLKKPFSELKFEEKTEFPRLRSDVWAQRFKMADVFQQMAKFRGNAFLKKYDWSKMSNMVEEYWKDQKNELKLLTNRLKEIGKTRPDIEQMISILILGTQQIGVSIEPKD